MIPMNKALCFFIVNFFCSVFFSELLAQEKAKKFELNDINKLTTLSEPQISPDGKAIVFAVSKPDEVKNQHFSDLYLVDTASGNLKKLTGKMLYAGYPRWSPSGDQVAFIGISESDNLMISQIYLISAHGGEIMKLTGSPTGVEQFAWSPDGRKIAYVRSDETSNKMGNNNGYDAIEIEYNSMYLTQRPVPSHIWLISAEGGNERRLTFGTWSVAGSGISWSPDGKEIAFQKNEIPKSGKFCSTIQVVDIKTGEHKRITKRDNKHSMIYETSPSFSPDGKFITYCFPGDGIINGSEIYIVNSNGGDDGKCITCELDRCFYNSVWLPDGQGILAEASDVNTVSIWKIQTNGRTGKIDLGELCITSDHGYNLSAGPGGVVAFIASTGSSPQELYIMSSSDLSPRKLTDYNKDFAKMNLGRQETITWKSDSFEPNGILTFPPDFDTTQQYPLVIQIHGGPDKSSKEQFNPEAQFLASGGYIVFEPNYRGSDNLGNDFLMAIKKNQGRDPGRDIMRGIEKLKERSYIDKNRIAVTGWSYGGFMTAWLIGKYQGWKCAIAGAAITDLSDQYALSDIGYAFKYHLGNGKSPFSDPRTSKKWKKQSPMTYAGNVKTPTMLMSCAKDDRVPVAHSFKFYRAIQDYGNECRLIVLPTQGHYPSDPLGIKERYRIWQEWLDKYLSQK